MAARKNRATCSLFVRALVPRFLFLGHGVLCVSLVSKQEHNNEYWYLTVCLGLLILEGIFNVLIRHGKEFHWVCPSAFLYAIVLITTLIVLRERRVKCLVTKSSVFCDKSVLDGNDAITTLFDDMTESKRASILEQTGMLVLIIGRWLLPQGSISKEAFSQILLIYIGTAADIVEFSEIYGEDDEQLKKQLKEDTADVLHGVMAVWALSVLQFSLTIALPEDALKQEEEGSSDEEENDVRESSYFQAKLSNKIAPMSYMHYKSMLREGFQQKPRLDKNLKRSPSDAQLAFKEKYDNTSKTLRSLRLRAGSMQENKTTEANYTINYTCSSLENNKSKADAPSPKTNTIPSRVKLPQGERVPTNIGSPNSIRSLRTGKTSSIRSNKFMRSPRSSKSSRSTESRKSNYSSESNKKISTWQRLVERAPFSKKEKRKNRKDSTKADNSLGIGKKEMQGCFLRYLDLIGILIPVCLQDGPFFILRFVLVVHYNIVTEMIFLLTTKNALVVILQVYRILLMYCSEPKKEPDVNDPSTRVRTAMDTNKKLSEKSPFRVQRASIAIQAISRMHTQVNQTAGPGSGKNLPMIEDGRSHVVINVQD